MTQINNFFQSIGMLSFEKTICVFSNLSPVSITQKCTNTPAVRILKAPAVQPLRLKDLLFQV